MPQENIHYQAAEHREKKKKFNHASALNFFIDEIARCNGTIAVSRAFPAFIKAQKLAEKKLRQLEKLASYHAKKTRPKTKKVKAQLEPAISLVDLELLGKFEQANNLDASLTLYADGSGTLNIHDCYHEFEDSTDLRTLLAKLQSEAN